MAKILYQQKTTQSVRLLKLDYLHGWGAVEGEMTWDFEPKRDTRYQHQFWIPLKAAGGGRETGVKGFRVSMSPLSLNEIFACIQEKRGPRVRRLTSTSVTIPLDGSSFIQWRYYYMDSRIPGGLIITEDGFEFALRVRGTMPKDDHEQLRTISLRTVSVRSAMLAVSRL